MNVIAPIGLISEPGIYDMPSAAYHADPCPTPSLSAGMINGLLRAPALCYAKSSRLNPDFKDPTDDGKFTFGTVAHLIFLEPHLFDERVIVVDESDWRKKEAKATRAAAQESGRTAILSKHMDLVYAARKTFAAQALTSGAFDGGKFEQSMFWRHPRYGFWCRARADFLADSGRHINDYKSTADADPARFGKHAYSMGYHRRAAWYLEGAQVLLRTRPEHYWFCNQETSEPHLTSIVELDEEAIEAGQIECERAAETFLRCLQTGDWHGYRKRDDQTRDTAFRVGLPPWAYMQIDRGF